MQVHIKYKREFESPVTTEVELHKNAKGYNINIEGKFYFPYRDNPVIKYPEKFQDKELWVVIKEDKFNYGNIAFAVPDYFIVPDMNKKELRVEKEIPLNQLDNVDEPFKWDYEVLAKVSDPDKTEDFIDELEEKGCPEKLIKLALNEFYDNFNF